jgi:ribosomal-protein-alanine N-acetyltransferase
VKELELSTERLLLRPLDRVTLLNLSKGMIVGPSLEGTKVSNGWPLSELLEAVPVMFNDLSDDPSSFGWHAWVVVNKATGEVIGDVGFKGPPDENGVVEIGFSIMPEHRGKGYAKEAVKAMTDHAVSTGKVRAIIAECNKDNIESLKVLDALGMRKRKTLGNRIFLGLEHSPITI